MRLIKADDIPYAVNIDHPSGEYDYAYRCEIDAMPTVDAVPVVHGYWKEVTMSEITGYDPTLTSYYDPVYGHVCSVCKCDAIVSDCGDEILSRFCPNCGARMDDNG